MIHKCFFISFSFFLVDIFVFILSLKTHLIFLKTNLLNNESNTYENKFVVEEISFKLFFFYIYLTLFEGVFGWPSLGLK